jgi:hypothetical protein
LSALDTLLQRVRENPWLLDLIEKEATDPDPTTRRILPPPPTMPQDATRVAPRPSPQQPQRPQLPQASIGPAPESLLDKVFPAAGNALRRAQRAVRVPEAQPNPFAALGAITGVSEALRTGNPMEIVEGPSAAAINGIGRIGRNAAEVGFKASKASGGLLRQGAQELERVAELPIPHAAARTNAQRTPQVNFRQVTPEEFLPAIQSASQAQKGGKSAGSMLSVYSPEEYAGMRTFLSDDGLTGFAIKKDGDLVSVFNQGTPGAGASAVIAGVEQGAKKLDAFEPYLPAFYRQLGFEPTGTFPNWDLGEDPVTFMRYRGGDPADLRSRVGTFPDLKRPTPRFDEYRPDGLAGLSAGDVRQGIDVAAARAIRRAPVEPATMAQIEAPIPASGVFQKPKRIEVLDASGSPVLDADGNPKTRGMGKNHPLPKASVVAKRLQKADAAITHLEQRPIEVFRPVERGFFDRGAGVADPHYRVQLPGVGPIPNATGSPDPVLAELINHPKLLPLLKRQVNMGLPIGGLPFYNRSVVSASFDDMLSRPDLFEFDNLANQTPFDFKDWMGASGSGSIQTPLPREIHNASLLLYGRRHGLPLDDVREIFKQRFPDFQDPWTSIGHQQKFDEYLRTGTINPGGLSRPNASGSRKVPNYFRGEGPVIDTHESKAVLWPVGAERYTDGLTGAQYEQVGDLYERGAREMGLPVETFQAGRWFGGGPATGLDSPSGDLVQTMEDTLLWSMIMMGRGTSPRDKAKYWRDVSQGLDFVMPFYGSGSPLRGLLIP